ncbi:PUB domain-containing protein [Trichonephila inaurata madagascariensis]|uniref:PUB domain-containing protein n=1 Tax=Trichonephila inaurata madagascariensis TaxID=2747483 RepID=A0A8X6WRS7_9ARAC|nr:PUB domain-containing protein [Trichonephila inaurata madagascariensis]
MVEHDSLRKYLRELIKEHDSKVARTAIETLLKIHRNILYNDHDNRYRIMKYENKSFQEKIWSILPARQFMKKSGWISAQDRLVFTCDERLVEIIEILLEFRSFVLPHEHEWVKDNKFEGKSEEQLREEQLRRKAVIEREKEIAEFQRDKKEREDIAKKVKAEIKADRSKREQFQGCIPKHGKRI